MKLTQCYKEIGMKRNQWKVIYSITGHNDAKVGVCDKVSIDLEAYSEEEALRKAYRYAKRDHYVINTIRCR